MASTKIARSLLFSHFPSSLSYLSRSLSHLSPPPTPFPTTPLSPPPLSLRQFCTKPKTPNPRLVNFSPPDSDSDDPPPPPPSPPKLPPPYDPFSKKPAIEEPEDPTNLQEVFHKIRTDGLFNSALKMFDGLSKDGLTHEALELLGQIKDKGQMPDVVAHTAVIEAYVNAGQAREGHKVYLRMLASGVMPNAYTYSVLVRGLARDGRMVGEARKYVVEMVGKGMKPNAGTYVAVLEGLVGEGRGVEEGREFVEEMKGRGYVVDEKAVREALRERRGPVARTVMDLLFGK